MLKPLFYLSYFVNYDLKIAITTKPTFNQKNQHSLVSQYEQIND